MEILERTLYHTGIVLADDFSPSILSPISMLSMHFS